VKSGFVTGTANLADYFFHQAEVINGACRQRCDVSYRPGARYQVLRTPLPSHTFDHHQEIRFSNVLVRKTASARKVAAYPIHWRSFRRERLMIILLRCGAAARLIGGIYAKKCHQR
jgi:hypothetical protein